MAGRDVICILHDNIQFKQASEVQPYIVIAKSFHQWGSHCIRMKLNYVWTSKQVAGGIYIIIMCMSVSFTSQSDDQYEILAI